MSDEEGEAEAMRQMMGFSSFGTSQRPKKEPQEPTTGESAASGANSAPLAKRAKTTNMPSKMKALSSSPPTFWPSSLPPPAKLAASHGIVSSAQSYSTPSEQQRLSGNPTAFSRQDDRYGPAPGSVLSPATQDARHVAVSAPAVLPHTSQSPQNPRLGRPQGEAHYTNPQTGISLTREELLAWKRGKVNARGDVVYFQPSFIDPDPWKGPKKTEAVGR